MTSCFGPVHSASTDVCALSIRTSTLALSFPASRRCAAGQPRGGGPRPSDEQYNVSSPTTTHLQPLALHSHHHSSLDVTLAPAPEYNAPFTSEAADLPVCLRCMYAVARALDVRPAGHPALLRPAGGEWPPTCTPPLSSTLLAKWYSDHELNPGLAGPGFAGS